ncbi:MAG: nitrous oxide reductase accessory protein NosL [Ferruginibacter sp.]
MTLNRVYLLLFLLAAINLLSCNTAPEPIKVGTDNCYFCKMTISDDRFGAEIVTTKGKVYKFDDTHCILSYLKSKYLPEANIKTIYLTNFSGQHQLLNTQKIFLLKSELLHSPMNGNIAAFENADSLKLMQQKFPGEIVNWEVLLKQ